ncbi:unnamed protein product [Eruca vesicaria subsp. sativa]|uniref:Uncharacterized protein n=1 Tax=Eruca vesicaria subsp. sativa TaxID=29727 RepID=A0ABC8LDU1_ERUVS|nr:unnamed protein product [Eruca vesicaria subsp. sativa]
MGARILGDKQIYSSQASQKNFFDISSLVLSLCGCPNFIKMGLQSNLIRRGGNSSFTRRRRKKTSVIHDISKKKLCGTISRVRNKESKLAIEVGRTRSRWIDIEDVSPTEQRSDIILTSLKLPNKFGDLESRQMLTKLTAPLELLLTQRIKGKTHRKRQIRRKQYQVVYRGTVVGKIKETEFSWYTRTSPLKKD